MECTPERCFAEVSKCSILNEDLLLNKFKIKDDGSDGSECQFKDIGEYFVLDIAPTDCGIDVGENQTTYTLALQAEYKAHEPFADTSRPVDLSVSATPQGI